MKYEIISILDNILGMHRRHANDEYYWSCPFCHHHNPKLAINISKNAWHCWVCERSGKRITSLLKQIGTPDDDIVKIAKLLDEYTPIVTTQNSPGILTLPSEYKPFHKYTDVDEYKVALKYLKDRGLSAQDILKHRIGYADRGLYRGRIIVPSYDVNGNLNYFIARSYDGSSLKYKNPPTSKDVVMFDNMINWGYPVVLCEGAFDAIAIRRNAIPLLGKTIMPSVMMRLMNPLVTDVYIALDVDAMKNTIRSIETLLKENKRVYYVPLDDKDPANIGFQHMQHLIKNSTQVTFSDLVKLKVGF